MDPRDERTPESVQQATIAQMRREIRLQADQISDEVEGTLIDYFEDMELNESLMRLHDVLADWLERGGGRGQATRAAG